MKLIVRRRKLTQGECELAQQVFGQALDVTHIEIIAHRLILKGYAMSPNGCLYFNPKDWVENFAVENITQQSWFIHELVHVWQLQQGIKVIRKALFDRRYDYVLKYGKGFVSYGIEQQAQMVQDYFMKKKQGQDCADLEACIPFIHKN